MEVLLDGKPEKLDSLWEGVGDRAEIYLTSPSGVSLTALLNGQRGWLMYLRHEGDAGFSSRNPGYTGSRDDAISYRLGNGQLDDYPAHWALPLAEVRRAVQYFAENAGARPLGVEWHDESF